MKHAPLALALFVGLGGAAFWAVGCGEEVGDDGVTPGDDDDDKKSGDDTATGDDTGPSPTSTSTTSPPDSTAPKRAYACGKFDAGADTGWTVTAGFAASVVVESAKFNQASALTLAGGAFGGDLFVVGQFDNILYRVNPDTGAVTEFTAGAKWGDGGAPTRLTSLVWDAEGVFDGNLYVADIGSDGDGDSVVYRVKPDGTATRFAAGPGAGLDDVFSMAFAPKAGAYAQGLYVGGDTDGAGTHWGRIDKDGKSVDFSGLSDSDGIAFVQGAPFNGALVAARPNQGGFNNGEGTDDVVRISADGGKVSAVATLEGVHALTAANGGALGPRLYAASFTKNTLNAIDTDGGAPEIATGLSLSNYDGNMIAISPDGNTMFVADSSRNRIVCVSKK